MCKERLITVRAPTHHSADTVATVYNITLMANKPPTENVVNENEQFTAQEMYLTRSGYILIGNTNLFQHLSQYVQTSNTYRPILAKRENLFWITTNQF